MSNKFVPDADAFRFYDGRGAEDTSAPAAAENTNIEMDTDGLSNFVFVLRYRVQEVGDGDVDGDATDDYQLQFRENGGGGWSDVTASSANPIKFSPFDYPQFDNLNGDPTTNRTQDGISDGTGSFDAGQIATGITFVFDHLQAGNSWTEHMYCLVTQNVQWGGVDFIEFRMRYNGGGMNNAFVPRITKKIFIPDVHVFRFYEDGTESGSTPLAAENIDLLAFDMLSGDRDIHLRLGVEEDGGTSGATTDDYHLFASHLGVVFPVTTSSSVVKADSASGLTGGNDTTDRSTDGITDGVGTFVAGEQSETGTVTDRQLTASNFTEHVYSLVVIANDVSHGDVIGFSLRGPTDGIFDNLGSAGASIVVLKGFLRGVITAPGIIPFFRP